MKKISSRENAFYKELKQLALSPHARRKASRSLLDGVHLCDAYLQQGGRPLIALASEASASSPEIADILKRTELAGHEPVLVPDALYKPLSQVESGAGILFLIETPAGEIPARLHRSALLLDRLQDPGNMGSILRSAAAAGVADVFCSPDTAHAWSPKVLRAGMGAHFFLNIVENVTLAPLLKSSEVPVVATSSHATHAIFDLDLRGPVAWMFGHEGKGISPELLSQAAHLATIPQLAPVESLNVAASVAICLFEHVRQNRSVGSGLH